MTKKIPILSPPDMVDDVLFDMTHSILNTPIGEHSHNCIEITITYGGNAVNSTEKESEHLQRGDVCIILEGGSHAITECREFEHITISCSSEILERIGINLSFIHGVNELFANSRKKTFFHLNSSEFNDAKRLIDTMFDAYQKNKSTEKGNLRSYFAMLICLLAQSYSLHHNSNSVSGRLDNVVVYMNKHFKERIPLSEIAAVASLSVSQFVRVFKQYYGTTPIDYIIELRLNESRRLLKYTNLSISEIAYLSGFSDSNYFSRLFKKRFGISPVQSRDKTAGMAQ